MDPNASSWLGEVCQKFEAMFVEVKSVGDSVQKLCSDAINELFPLLDVPIERERREWNPMEQENPEWNVMYNFYMGRVYEKPIIRNQYKSLDSELNVSGYSNLSNLSEFPSADSTCFDDDNSEEKLHSSEISVMTETPIEDGVATISNPENVECIASTSSIISSPGPVICDEYENDNDPPKKSDGMSYEQAEDEIESNAGVKEEHQVQVSEQVGMSYELPEIESNAGVKEELQVQVSEQFSKIKRDESCVLVDKCEHISIADPQGEKRSYKRKIQDVFQLRRRWSSSKCKEQHKTLHQNEKSSIQESGKMADSSASPLECESNSLESGWEIL